MGICYVFEPVSALVIVVGGVLAVLIAGMDLALRLMAMHPAKMLRGQE